DPGSAKVVASDGAAAKEVAEQAYSRVFLTTGRSGVAAFADSDAWFLIRAVTPPDDTAMPKHHQLLLSRGPYHYDEELRIL
ncbi:precorrin-6A/cobalt-precorrin-6A reductase, partial [Mycobacterium kansasii]